MDPTYIEIEPTLGCNLRCRMCHTAFLDAPPQFLDFERIDFSFLRGRLVAVGAVFEPFIHPRINEFIATLNRHDCRLVLITNGHNLHRKSVPALFDSRLEMVTFSFDGIGRDCYELVRRGGNYERTLDNIQQFREAFAGSEAIFAINYTVLKANLHEVAAAPEFWNRRGFDVLRFIAMVVREPDDFIVRNSLWDVRKQYFAALDEALASAKAKDMRITLTSPYYQFRHGLPDGIAAPDRPDAKPPRLFHREELFGQEPGLLYPCKAPFRSARILWDGTVMLCHNMPVGNLSRKSFKQIWRGAEAVTLRDKVLHGTELCDKCDYFRLCLNSHSLDLDKAENYFSQEMLASRRG